MESGPFPEYPFGQALEFGNIQQSKASTNEVAHLLAELLAEEDKAAAALLTFKVHDAWSRHLRSRLDAIKSQADSIHDKARADRLALQSDILGGVTR